MGREKANSRLARSEGGRGNGLARDSGEDQILLRTVPRKGFRFVGEVSEVREASFSEASPAEASAAALDADKPSIAVMPFQNFSGDPGQAYFADGVMEEIITALSRVRWLFVIARNSSFTYRDRNVDLEQVGRELGVRYVLEGSLRKAGDLVRITGQLIEASSGAHLWAERFEGHLEDIFALQDEIAASVVGAIAHRWSSPRSSEQSATRRVLDGL